MLASASGGCGGDGVGPSDIPIGLPADELAEITEVVSFENDRGEEIMGLLTLPEGDGAVPAVVVLHGAGGLFSEPDSNDQALELSPQFEEWAGLLVAQGYAVLLPSSFYSRGFLEWNDRPDEYDSEDRILMRVYDAQAALGFACAHPRIDCDRIAALGFSNGASTVVMSAHERLGEVPGMEQLRSERPRFALGVAYYPGCGLHALISLDMDDPTEFYFPYMPVLVQHAEDDSLLDDCTTRLEQTDIITGLEGYASNPFQLDIHADAGHGFDSSPNDSREEQARATARQRTLDRLARDLL